ncbi:MAG: hypothetical protein CVU71_08795 [Deltaproteobacteria bacterium HGW-Deltaproteobacteria-6]|jgi:uncharacterized protein YigA (DUF484 family)|nr:MAG: hypothetical protein CVU71_08795 [Deltaproteobacteria bacterium HGW-Deltaproteobacteria-6]
MGKKEDIQLINDEIAARFCKIESGIAAAETIAGLFEFLLTGIEKEFKVPFVWLTIIDNVGTAPLIDAVNASEILKNRLCVISQDAFEKILPHGLKPVLANKNLQPFYKMMPSSRKYFVRSIAVAPFTLDGQVVGAWNNGDADPDRYAADMDSTLLAALARKISLKLTALVAGKAAVSDNRNTEQPGGLHG